MGAGLDPDDVAFGVHSLRDDRKVRHVVAGAFEGTDGVLGIGEVAVDSDGRVAFRLREGQMIVFVFPAGFSFPFDGAGGTGVTAGTASSPAAWVSRLRNAPSSP